MVESISIPAPAPTQNHALQTRVVDYLIKDGWTIQQGADFLNTRIRGTNGDSFRLFISFDEELLRIVAYTISDTVIVENKRLIVAEFFTRLNYGMSIGNFELDMSDGEIRYRTSIALADNIEFFTDTAIDSLIWVNVNTLDKYFRTIMSINYSPETNINVKDLYEKLRASS